MKLFDKPVFRKNKNSNKIIRFDISNNNEKLAKKLKKLSKF